ncbi:MAG: Rab family GTPase [Candidatus Odinarchaeota archaeon]
MIEYHFKVIVIGPGGVGKSSLIRRFVENKFTFNYKFTIGVEISSKMVEYEKGSSARLTIWDIGGQDRFKVVRHNFYEGTHGALVVFDISRAETFLNMQEWISDMKNILEKDVPFIILGNKSDLISEIGESINVSEPKQFAGKADSKYIETSAKSGNNVEEAFAELTKRIVDSFKI